MKKLFTFVFYKRFAKSKDSGLLRIFVNYYIGSWIQSLEWSTQARTNELFW